MVRHSVQGFTLIELVMVIVIIGILAVVAIPRFIDLADQARAAAEQGVVGGVRGGIYTYYAANRTFPTSLDTQSDGACVSCFDEVLTQGGVNDALWNKAGNTYTGPTGTSYTYNSADGTFD